MKEEKSHLTQPAQRRYKRQRRKNDIYTTMGGHKNPKSGHPFSGKVKRFGTDPLRFEGLRITKSQLKQIIKEELAAVLSERQKLEEAYIDFSFGSMLSKEEKSIILGGLSSAEGP